jgi:CBS domain containing-hemolysin-like protein
MIHSVFEFNDTVVREVMVPRPDMVVVEEQTPLSEVLEMVVERGFSRIPVYRGDVDHVVGLLYAKDILARLKPSGIAQSVTAGEIVRPATFVPETKRISELLREMQQRKFHLAIVFDEYGSPTGLVTLEDLIEEIVGEIVDEYDTEEPQVEVIDANTVRVNARLPIDEVKELLDADLSDGEWDTVGGLVISQLGRVPVPDETVTFEGLQFTTERVEGHRILTVRIHRAPLDKQPTPAEVV